MTFIAHDLKVPFQGLGQWYTNDASHFACTPYSSIFIPKKPLC